MLGRNGPKGPVDVMEETMTKRLLVLLSILALVFAACGGDDGGTDDTDGGSDTTEAAGSDTTQATGGDDEIIVGVSWNNFNEPRWANFDEPAIIAAVEAGGGSYISTDAGSSADTQLADVENLISQGADVIIILAQDGTAILPAVQAALNEGIPVIAYDRLIEDPGAFYLTFDNVGVGRIEAEVIYGLVPEGNYAIIKGNSADANADFLRAGMEEVIGDAVAAGDITIVCEEYTDNWDPAIAQTNMEQCLTQADNDIDAVLAQNDGMAGGVVAALEAQGLAGTVPVSGQDGDVNALNRVALGTQAVSVWKDSRVLGKTAGEVAIALATGTALEDIEGSIQFDTPGGNTMTTILLDPNPITQENLQEVLDAGVIDEATLCQGVEPGSVDVCP
jgi:D-xylose transport system substrate-binding protein